METVFGIKCQSQDDPYISLAEDAMVSLAAAGNPGTYIGAYFVFQRINS